MENVYISLKGIHMQFPPYKKSLAVVHIFFHWRLIALTNGPHRLAV